MKKVLNIFGDIVSTATENTDVTPSMVNYFLINRDVYFVDLPGYGYAAVGQAEKCLMG